MIDSLFGSKTRVKLLNLFLNNLDQSFYVREITRLIDEQINSVRRELANMVSVGVVKCDSVDNKLYYSADLSYEYIKPLSEIFAGGVNIQNDPQKKSWIELVKKIPNVKLAVVSNKTLTNQKAAVDLLLVGNISQTSVNKLIRAIESAEKREINYVVMTYEDFYYRFSLKDKFILDIVSDDCTIIMDKENLLKGVNGA